MSTPSPATAACSHGGHTNTASGQLSAVSGGSNNVASGAHSSVYGFIYQVADNNSEYAP